MVLTWRTYNVPGHIMYPPIPEFPFPSLFSAVLSIPIKCIYNFLILIPSIEFQFMERRGPRPILVVFQI